MKYSINKLYHYDPVGKKSSQSGATLIIVLLILILITSIGVIAVKNSNTDLRVSTSQQVDKLLFQANDAAFTKVEKEDRLNATTGAQLDDLKGYITSDQVKDAEEVVFCVRPRQKELFRVDKITVKNKSGTVYADRNAGYCDVTKRDDYVNEGRVVTQLTFVKEEAKAAIAIWSRELKQTSSNDFSRPAGEEQATPLCVTFTGYATSIIPLISDASDDDINKCLKMGYSGDGTTVQTVNSCLDGLGAAYETQMQTYKNIPTGYSCL